MYLKFRLESTLREVDNSCMSPLDTKLQEQSTPLNRVDSDAFAVSVRYSEIPIHRPEMHVFSQTVRQKEEVQLCTSFIGAVVTFCSCKKYLCNHRGSPFDVSHIINARIQAFQILLPIRITAYGNCKPGR